MPLTTTSEQRVAAAAVQANVVPFLIGDPALNKSAWIESTFTAWGYHVETVVPSYRDQSDFNGLPVVNTDTWQVDLAAPAWAHRCNAATNGAILFLDEWTMASDQVKGAALRLLRERWVGEVKLADHVRIILAGNGLDTSVGGWEMPAPAANRMLHLNWRGVPYDTWADGLVNGWDTITPPNIMPEHPTAERRMMKRVLVAGYIRQGGNAVLHDLPRDRGAAGGPWASRRTWEMVADVLPYLDDKNTDDLLTLTTAAVGPGQATAFASFVKNADLPDPKAVIADPSIYDWKDSRLDRTFMVLASTTSVANDGKKDTWTKQWDVFAAAASAGRTDVAAAQVLAHIRNAKTGWLPPRTALVHFGKAMRAAGLLSA